MINKESSFVINILSHTLYFQPLFLYLPFQAVHSANKNGINLQAPKSYIDKFSYIENEDRRVYAGEIR